ncbi:MAG: sterol desaturase family protein [Gammaproteobacteria bacterium]|nr:sterol desaturase family protein [Gammaproteobacteria bacterium]
MEILATITLATIPAFLLLDFLIQKRKFNKPRYWRLQGLLVTGAIFYFTGEIGVFWGTVTEGYSLLNLSGLGIAAGTVIGILVYELVHYWYHRAAHTWNWLWFAGHQMHHSAESLDAFGAYYLHPFDAAMFTTWGSLVFFPLLGVAPEAGAIAALFLTFNAMFQHANIKTPHWLGYLIQRPESHTIHHGRGIHRYNYADLPLWDMVFGTFRNPRSVEGQEVGFYNGASTRIPAMLIGKDVSKPVAPEREPNEVFFRHSN